MRLEKIINNITNFTDSEKKIIEYILNDKCEIIKMSSFRLAEITYTSPATITRLSKKLGCSGFNELKHLINNEIRNDTIIPTGENHFTLLKKDIHDTMNYIEKTDFSEVTKLLKEANRIYTFGTGWGEKHGLDMFMRNFLAINIHNVGVPSITEFKWIANEINKNDLVILISYSGKNKEVIELIKKFRLRDIPVISITPMTDNEVASLSTISLYYAVTELAATKSTMNADHNMFTTLHILLDAIYRVYLNYEK